MRHEASNYHPYCSRDLDLDLVTFIYEPDLNILKLYPHTKKELSRSRLSKVIVLISYREIDLDATKNITTTLGGRQSSDISTANKTVQCA